MLINRHKSFEKAIIPSWLNASKKLFLHGTFYLLFTIGLNEESQRNLTSHASKGESFLPIAPYRDWPCMIYFFPARLKMTACHSLFLLILSHLYRYFSGNHMICCQGK